MSYFRAEWRILKYKTIEFEIFCIDVFQVLSEILLCLTGNDRKESICHVEAGFDGTTSSIGLNLLEIIAVIGSHYIRSVWKGENLPGQSDFKARNIRRLCV